MGETGGEPNVTLLQTQIKVAHAFGALAASNSDTGPTTIFGGRRTRKTEAGAAASGSPATMSAAAVGTAGGNQPHNNLPPYLVSNYVIAMVGIYRHVLSRWKICAIEPRPG